MRIWEQQPCWTAFLLELDLPSGEVGPVEWPGRSASEAGISIAHKFAAWRVRMSGRIGAYRVAAKGIRKFRRLVNGLGTGQMEGKLRNEVGWDCGARRDLWRAEKRS
ncbi:MAG: hypothetical protein ACRD4O_06330, partial [Bryobacteraceae bacterium]